MSITNYVCISKSDPSSNQSGGVRSRVKRLSGDEISKANSARPRAASLLYKPGFRIMFGSLWAQWFRSVGSRPLFILPEIERTREGAERSFGRGFD
jgi:hypothetical protein